MLLVGSHALQCYMPVNRVLHDWDIWVTDDMYDELMVKYKDFMVKETPHCTIFDIHGKIFEVKPRSKFELTDSLIFDNLKVAQFVKTPGRYY